MFRYILSVIIPTALLLTASASGVRAHEGHNHGPETPPAPVSVAPRGEAHSERFELVAVADGKTLRIFLDDYKTNAPVQQAELEVETPTGPMAAKAQGDGVFIIEAPFLEPGGRFDLIVTIMADGDPDILPVSIDVPTTAAKPDGASAMTGFDMVLASLSRSPLATGVTGFVLGALVVLLLRRPRRTGAALVLPLLIAATSASAHEGHDHGPEPAIMVNGDQRAMRQPDGSVFVPKPIQRIFGLRTIEARPGRKMGHINRILRN